MGEGARPDAAGALRRRGDRRRRPRRWPRRAADGPAYAVPRMLARNELSLQDFDFYEIHEAFAAQVLSTLAAWEDPVFCHERLGLDAPLGSIDRAKLNVKGGRSPPRIHSPRPAAGSSATWRRSCMRTGRPRADLDLRGGRPGRRRDPRGLNRAASPQGDPDTDDRHLLRTRQQLGGRLRRQEPRPAGSRCRRPLRRGRAAD